MLTIARLGGRGSVPFVEGHMSRTSVVLTLVRLGGRCSGSIVISAASPQVYLRLWACGGDVQQDGRVSVLPVRTVPKTSSPDDDVHPQVLVCSERFTALHFVEFRAASTCRRSRASAAPRLWDRCVRAGCPRPLHHSRGISSPRAPQSL